MWLNLLGALVLVSLVALVLYPRADFKVQVRDGQIECRGKLPHAVKADLARLLGELQLGAPLKILGKWQGKKLRLWFRGRVSKGDRQAIRNFFQASGFSL